MASKRTRQQIVDELDELGIRFDENDKYSNLLALLKSKKEELNVTDYKLGDNAVVKEKTSVMPDEPVIEKKNQPLPNGLVEIEVTLEELMQLQKDCKLVGYTEINNGLEEPKRKVFKRLAIIREKG